MNKCNMDLQSSGAPNPRTCAVCGIGKCTKYPPIQAPSGWKIAPEHGLRYYGGELQQAWVTVFGPHEIEWRNIPNVPIPVVKPRHARTDLTVANGAGRVVCSCGWQSPVIQDADMYDPAYLSPNDWWGWHAVQCSSQEIKHSLEKWLNDYQQDLKNAT